MYRNDGQERRTPPETGQLRREKNPAFHMPYTEHSDDSLAVAYDL